MGECRTTLHDWKHILGRKQGKTCDQQQQDNDLNKNIKWVWLQSRQQSWKYTICNFFSALTEITYQFFLNSFFYQEWLLHIIIRLAKNTHLPVQIAFLHFGPTTRENRAKTARTLIIIINNFKMKFMKCISQLKFPSSSLVKVNMLTFKAQCINECIFFLIEVLGNAKKSHFGVPLSTGAF